MAKYAKTLVEEELKNKIACDFFSAYDCTKREDNIDFWVVSKESGTPLLWAESKKGKNNLTEAFIQLILTIGKHQTYARHVTPAWLAAFDATCISFIPYKAVMNVFSANDFNWNVTPSDHKSDSFKQLKAMIENAINESQAQFRFGDDDKALRSFIKKNIASGLIGSKVKITKSSFVSVFFQWLDAVKPTIEVNWDNLAGYGVMPRDFYLADLLSKDGTGLIENLSVLLENNHYRFRPGSRAGDSDLYGECTFSDEQKAYNAFWNKYERPPRREYWNYIVERADLLVPQDIRELKGSYFTPRIWVEKSQEYLAEYLGDDWQEQYFIWDCCAGTGNLEVGLYNRHRVWVSTLDASDVAIMRERIANGASLLDSHVFQFDFLNGDFAKLPESLKNVISDPEKRRRLVIYINPPYAEAANKRTVRRTGHNRTNVAVKTAVYKKYVNRIGIAGRELYAQFLARIYNEINGVVLANFSTLKNLQGENFSYFRKFFQAELKRLFIVPADTFDNVKGDFPIGFFIWDTSTEKPFQGFEADVFDRHGDNIGKKTIFVAPERTINNWLIATRNRTGEKRVGYMSAKGADFQNVAYNFIVNDKSCLPHPRGSWITDKNIIECGIYFAVRHVIEATWMNDRDQFRYPNDGWKKDKEFQTDCLVFTLFHNGNNIKSTNGVNHWIPFYENEVGAKDAFDSHFMADVLSEKTKTIDIGSLTYDETFIFDGELLFSDLARKVLESGKALWQYYHKQSKAQPNASFYDIKEYFQGRDASGVMNKTSADQIYNDLLRDLSQNLKLLSEQIAEKVYDYGFLLR